MKIRIILISLMLLGFVFVPIIRAQEPTAQSAEQLVKERCALAQNYLEDIQRPRDLRARVDRLQAYRYIYQRLDVFVERLERNQQPRSGELREILSQFSRDIDAFKNVYESYDAARDAVVKVKNCKANTAEFQKRLTKAREKRQAVADAITTAETLLNPEVRDNLEILHKTLLETGSMGGGRE